MAGSMKTKRWLLILLSLVLSALFLASVVFIIRFVRIEAEQAQYTSAMSWLNSQLRESLSVYYAGHKQYPDVLNKLEIPEYGDNATPEMLNNFLYSTDGRSYTLKWTTKKGNTIIQSGHFGTNGPMNNMMK